MRAAYFLAAFLATGACRMSGPSEPYALNSLLLPNESKVHVARLLLRGELDVALPPNLSPAETLKGGNAVRVRQLIDWQLQYLHGAVRHAGLPSDLAPVSLTGRQDVRILGVTVGATPTTAVVSYEYRDTLVARSEFSAAELDVKLPRDVTTIFSKTLASGGKVNNCADGGAVPEDHLWYFWNPSLPACRMGPEDVTTAHATLEPVSEKGPEAPDYQGLFGSKNEAVKLQAVYLIGDDHAYGSRGAGSGGAAAFDRALELLADAGFTLRAVRPDRRAALLAGRPGNGSNKRVVSLEVKLVDPASFEFVRASANALETADVFLYNGQTGFGNYLDWGRFERILGRRLALPKKSQIYSFNGASPFTFETARFFGGKSSADDPEGYDALDVVTTMPTLAPVAGGAVGIDVAVLSGLLSGSRPSWRDILDMGRRTVKQAGLMTYVTGGR